MGMFDSTYIRWRGRSIELQTKDFACVLGHWTVGARIDHSHRGIDTFIIDFNTEIDHINPLQPEKKCPDSNRFMVGVLKDGFWLDYAITPTFQSAQSLSMELKELYQNPAWAMRAWQWVALTRESGLHQQGEIVKQFLRFFSAFLDRKSPRRHNRISRLMLKIWEIPKQRSLTLKNLLEAGKILRDEFHVQSDHLGYQPWKEAFSFTTVNHFYERPQRTKKNGQHKNEHKEEHWNQQFNQQFKDSLKNLDFSFIQKLSHQDPAWWLAAPRDSILELEQLLVVCQKTNLGKMLWLDLRSHLLGMPLTKTEKWVRYDRNAKANAWLHFVEVLGVDEDWLKEALRIVPELAIIQKNPHPLVTIPAGYKDIIESWPATVDWKVIANEVDAHGLTPLHQSIRSTLLYGLEQVAFVEAQRWLDMGSDPNALDPQGNTPLMWLAMHGMERANHGHFWDENALWGEASRHVIHELLLHHSFSHLNDNGEGLLQLWPSTPEAQAIYARAEKEFIQRGSPVKSPGAQKHRL